jgi:hypothetical protein
MYVFLVPWARGPININQQHGNAYPTVSAKRDHSKASENEYWQVEWYPLSPMKLQTTCGCWSLLSRYQPAGAGIRASFGISIVIGSLADMRTEVKGGMAFYNITHHSRISMPNCEMILFLMDER